MYKFILLISIVSIQIFAKINIPRAIESNDSYLIDKHRNITYIYSGIYKNILPTLYIKQKKLLDRYQSDFGYKLDSKLFVGLASLNNQITNGFSTQTPFNSQMYYTSGSSMLDYFASSSWLDMLIAHESAHNYQLNAKENSLSKIAHKIAGNTPFSWFGLLPILPQPNAFIHSFFLEGNAVLNESRFGSGGRLYSGYTLAQNIILGRSGKIVPEFVYNNTLQYPYGETRYLVGGAFQAFLAQRYGIKKVDRFFKFYSKKYFRFSLDDTFKKYYGKSFVDLLKEFNQTLLAKHKNFTPSKGKLLAHSDAYVPLSHIGDKIITLISNRRSSPYIFSFDNNTHQVDIKKSYLPLGKVFKYHDQYLSQSSMHTSPNRIVSGLYDKNAIIAKETESKDILATMPDGRLVYEDIKHSLDIPHIYVGGKFYDTANSKAFVDAKGDIYYFKQKSNRRILYKNKKAIFSYNGYYGYVTDVDSLGYIYFVSVSKNGSTVYRVKSNKLQRVSDADDIVDMKLIDNHKMLVSSVTSNGFDYKIEPIRPKSSLIPTIHYSFENSKDKSLFDNTKKIIDLNMTHQKYSPLKELRYSSFTQIFGYSGLEGFFNNGYMLFADAMMQNALMLYGHYSKTNSILGVSYDNIANTISFGGSFELRFDNQKRKLANYGYDLYAKYPFLRLGYYSGDISAEYQKFSSSKNRRFWDIKLNLKNKKQFGISKYPDSLNSLKLIIGQDRDNGMFEASYDFMHLIDSQLYISLKAKYLKAQKSNDSSHYGIKLQDNAPFLSQNDFELDMPSFANGVYANDVKMAEAGVYKVFDKSAYFYLFPISLQRETLYGKYGIYNIKTENKSIKFSQTTLGAEFDLLLFHRMSIPLAIELTHNNTMKSKNSLRVLIKTAF